MYRHAWQNGKFTALRQQTSYTNSERIIDYLDQFLESNNNCKSAWLYWDLSYSFYIAQVWKRSSLKEIKFERDRVWNWVGPSTSKLDLCLFNSVVSNEHRLQEIVYRAAWLVQKRYLLSPTSWMATPTKQSCSLTDIYQPSASCIMYLHGACAKHISLREVNFGND